MEFITATVRQREASIALADGRGLGGQVGQVVGDQMYDLASRWMRPFTEFVSRRLAAYALLLAGLSVSRD